MDNKYFNNYRNTENGFDQFNLEVINMPRESFSDVGIEKLQILSSYLLLMEGRNKDYTYKEIMLAIKKILNQGKTPTLRDIDLEKKYFEFDIININKQYDDRGREFRHLMGLCKLFNILHNSNSSKRVEINFDKCKEFEFIDNDNLPLSIRNSILEINIKNNSFIKSLKGIKEHINNESDYPIALNIIKYMKEIKRPVTELEISFLLGRVDNLSNEKEIFNRALEIGRNLPLTFNEQKSWFFDYMNWINEDGSYFQYKSSSEPWFKFKTFLILMKQFGLIEFNEFDETIKLKDYSLEILSENIPAYIADLEVLLDNAENKGDTEIANIIVRSRQKGLEDYLEKDSSLIDLINKRSLQKSEKLQNENKARERSQLVMLFSKIYKNYKCDILYSVNDNGVPEFKYNQHLFLTNDNIGYCEGHHIIEFGKEKGPDIVENIILVDPNTHMLIHHGHTQLRKDLFGILRREGILSLDRFILMINKYNCLTYDHIDILSNKGIITFDEKFLLINEIEKRTNR